MLCTKYYEMLFKALMAGRGSSFWREAGPCPAGWIGLWEVLGIFGSEGGSGLTGTRRAASDVCRQGVLVCARSARCFHFQIDGLERANNFDSDARSPRRRQPDRWGLHVSLISLLSCGGLFFFLSGRDMAASRNHYTHPGADARADADTNVATPLRVAD